MGKLIVDITTSLDGFVAGPNQTLEDPLGAGGMRLHEWAFAAAAWREAHGIEGGEANADSDVVREGLDRVGATVMGRRMFSGGSGPWADDPNANGWWGDEPPLRHPRFVLPHHLFLPPPPRPRAARTRRHHVHVRHGRDRVGARAGAGRGGRQGRERR